jgi:UDP-glucose 4-epimerase
LILVTGASGFVGLNVVEQLLSEGREVVAFSATPVPDLARSAFASLPGRLHEETGDVRDEAALHRLFAQFKVRRVLHGAAITLGPKGTIAPPELVLDVNVVATAALLEASRGAEVERFVYTSSSAVYGEAAFGEAPLAEDVPPLPTGLYGMTKLAGERLVARARAVHDLNTVRARITAAFGPWEHDTGVRETLSPPLQVTAQALRGEEVVVAPRRA